MPRTSLATAVEPDRITVAARHVQGLVERSGLEVGLAIGEYLLEIFYEGDFARFHCKRGGPALRALAAHPDLQLSATYLYSAIAIAEQVQGWPPSLTHGLSFSHHRELLPIRAVEDRLRLAAMCWEGGWSCSRLGREVQERFPTPPTRRGRPRKAAVARCSEVIRDQLEAIGTGDWEDAERLFGRLGPEDAIEAVEAALRDATELSNRLRRLRVLARSRR